MSTPTIGVLAGVGALPIVAAREIKNQGFRCVVVALFPENSKELQQYADAYYFINPSEMGRIIATFQQENCTEIALLGKVSKQILYSDFRPDAHWMSIFNRLTSKNDDAVLMAIVDELAAHGITVFEQARFLGQTVLKLGVHTKREPTAEELANLRFGYHLAKGLAGLDIGQTIAIAKGAVLAVEAIDGTNATILRGGKLAQGPVTVLKVSKPQQDLRFDIPVVGLDTVESMKAAGGGVLALEADQVFFLDLPEAIEFADQNNITICAFNPRAVSAGEVELFQEGR